MARLHHCTLIALLFVFGAFSAHAGTEVTPSADFLLAAPTNISKDFQMEGAVGYVGKADFTNGLGSVDILRASLSADYSIFKLTYVASKFSWKEKVQVAQTFGTGGPIPWDTLHDLTLQARLLNNKLGDKWRYWINGELSSSFETDFPGAIGVGFDGGVAYEFWNGWMVGGTAKTIALSALNEDLFGEVELGIALAVSQKTLHQTLKAMGLFPDAASGSDDIGFSIAISGAEKTYRLADDNPIYRNGYLGLVRSKVGAYLDYAPNDNAILSIGPEYHYSRKYKLYNSTGSLKSSHTLDNTFGGYARFMWKF